MQAMRFNVAGLAAGQRDQVGCVREQRFGAVVFLAGERMPACFEVSDLRERLAVIHGTIAARAAIGLIAGQVERLEWVAVHIASL